MPLPIPPPAAPLDPLGGKAGPIGDAYCAEVIRIPLVSNCTSFASVAFICPRAISFLLSKAADFN